MIGLPHRVGAALVVLGKDNGMNKRINHSLNSNVYGEGSPNQSHNYFGEYPENTTPDYVITKTAGTLGDDYDYTNDDQNNIPGNILKIVSYKTEINHYLPTYANGADMNIPSYDSEALWYFTPTGVTPTRSGWRLDGLYDAETGESYEYQHVNSLPQFAAFVEGFRNSWTEITDVTDNLDGSVAQFDPSVFYPRWTTETAYNQSGQLNPPIRVSTTGENPYYQTRKGPAITAPATQVGIGWICPWSIGRINGGLNQRVDISCSVSYKFTKDGAHALNSVAQSIVYPLGKGYYSQFSGSWLYPDYNKVVPDESPRAFQYDWYGFYAGKLQAGSYRTTTCTVFPLMGSSGDQSPYVNYENKATHGLFLAANGSCWNIGTELKVKVHVWKAPPKFCLYYRNKDKTGGGYAYENWKWGQFSVPTADYYGGQPYPAPQLFGPGTGTFNDGDFRFEGGVNTGVDYSIPEPKSLLLHYWGTVFAPDTDSNLNVQHEILEFTVTISEGNTYACDGTPRDGVEMTPHGFKLEDIVLEPIEGYITYIKDFEVTWIKKPS